MRTKTSLKCYRIVVLVIVDLILKEGKGEKNEGHTGINRNN